MHASIHWFIFYFHYRLIANLLLRLHFVTTLPIVHLPSTRRVEILKSVAETVMFLSFTHVFICIIFKDVLKRFAKQFSTLLGKLFELWSHIKHQLLISLCNKPPFLLSPPRQMYYSINVQLQANLYLPLHAQVKFLSDSTRWTGVKINKL